MEKLGNKKNIKKRAFLIALSIIVVGAVILSITGVAATKSATKNTSSSGLSSAEIEKIMNEIQTSSNSSDVKAQLDAIIQRATLMGNDDLKSYAENTKQLYDLQDQMNTISATIKALTSKSKDIKKIDDQLKEAQNVNITFDDLRDVLPATSSAILATLSDDDLAKLESNLTGFSNLEDIKTDPGNTSDTDRNLLAIVLLKAAIDDGLLGDDQISLANEEITSLVALLVSTERAKYTDTEENDLKSKSEQFAKSGNKAASIGPEQVVLANTNFKLKNPAIIYDNNVLISLNDIFQFVNATISYTEDTATMAVKSKNIMLEITKGKNASYVNDKPQSIPAPVLSFNGVTYLSAEFFAETYGVSNIVLKDQNTIVFYNNLNQIS